jgi:hypothetical protein
MFTKSRYFLLVATVLVITVMGLWFSSRSVTQPVPLPIPIASCVAPHQINWPETNPVWSLCWTPPDASSGVNGSGLELRDVFYKGKRVFWQASVPVLNVKYDPGGCGGAYLSYRDWQNQLQAFEADNVLSPGYAEPTTPPKTVLDHPGTDAGTFAGVAVEKRSDRLTLTTQMSAGWYRYIQVWTFYPDGTIAPRFGFTAIASPCISKPHVHHVYWRFDFDIDRASPNVVEGSRILHTLPSNIWNALTTETSEKRANLLRFTRHWRVRNKTTGRGYEIVDAFQDGQADAWGDADRWDLRYHGNEQDDGGATSGPIGDAIHIDKYLNSENVDSQDVVVWYRAGYRHTNPAEGTLVGPLLKPFGPW